MKNWPYLIIVAALLGCNSTTTEVIEDDPPPANFEVTFLGTFVPLALNNQSQVLGYEDGQVLVAEADGTIHRMPSLGELATPSSISDQGVVVGATFSGSAFRWEPGLEPEIIYEATSSFVEAENLRWGQSERRNVWISPDGRMILTDTLLWRDRVREVLPPTPEGYPIEWQMVNSAGHLVGLGTSRNSPDVGLPRAGSVWTWDGESLEKVYAVIYGESSPRVLDFSEVGEIIMSFYIYSSFEVAIAHPAFPGLRTPNIRGTVGLPIRNCDTMLHCGDYSGRVNSLGTVLYNHPGIWREEPVPLRPLLVADGHSLLEDEEWGIEAFDINDQEELVMYMTIDGKKGTYFIRWVAAEDPPWR